MRKERRVKAQVDRVVSGSRHFVSAEATFTPVLESSSDVLRHPHVVDSTLRFRPHLKVSLSLSGEKNQKSAFSLNADVDSELWKSGLKSHLLKPIQEGLSSGFSKGSLSHLFSTAFQLAMSNFQEITPSFETLFEIS